MKRPIARFLAPLLLCQIAATLSPGAEPAFTFGAVADIQYGDKETKGRRRYRDALGLLSRCVEKFNAEKPAFVVQCGDLYDGYGKEKPREAQADARRVLPVLRGIAAPLHHVVGNHCLTAGGDFVKRELRLDKFHYAFTAPEAKGWRFVVLDGNDAGYGVMAADQIAWLRATLDAASSAGERVIVFCHFPLLKEAARSHRLQNADAVLPVVESFPCVAAWIAGHDHAGGYCRKAGIHHVTLKGLVESSGDPDYAFFTVHPDRIVEDGFGGEPDREMALGNGP